MTGPALEVSAPRDLSRTTENKFSRTVSPSPAWQCLTTSTGTESSGTTSA